MATKLTINEMRQIAIKKGGKCLSEKYINAETKLKWQCAKGHKWEAKPMHVIRGHWCHECGGSKRLSIFDVQQLALEKGGKCLSKKYINAHHMLTWECAQWHRWNASFANIKYGKAWCPRCSKRKRSTIEDMQQIAKQSGGKCLSKKYTDATTALLWQCDAGHIWEAIPASIMRGSWCGICSGNAPLSIKEMQKIADDREGVCLSTQYVNSSTSLKWQCADGHEWKATPSSIKMGSWCPECGLKNILENICREIFEKIFNKKFPKIKPKWLINDDGNRMEFDGYNKELHLAFEYHGEQHYKYKEFFYRGSVEKFIKRKDDDNRKHQLSKDRGVRLIEIPHTVAVLDLYKYIITQCDNLGVQIPRHNKINVKAIQSTYRAKNLLLLQEIAKEYGGRLISKIYLGTHSSHVWECSIGHQWEAAPHNIKRGRWCPKCAKETIGNLTRLDIRQMQELAKKHGGKSLSKEYCNARTKLKWQCVNNHIWEATPNKIQQGRWCAKCSRRHPLDMKEMQEIAKKKGGRCLSAKYINARTKLRWQCFYGHEWEAVPDSVKRSTWCPVCAINLVKRKV